MISTIGDLRNTVNLSISIMSSFWSLKTKGNPRSSCLGAMNIRTVPRRGALLRLLATILYVKSAWFRWVNLARTAPRGVKSRPRDRSTSLLVQKVAIRFAGWFGVCTPMSVISTPGKSNWNPRNERKKAIKFRYSHSVQGFHDKFPCRISLKKF